ncbi:MAG: delta-60 repeat domain-containing protein [Limisphaerales bacterium]
MRFGTPSILLLSLFWAGVDCWNSYSSVSNEAAPATDRPFATNSTAIGTPGVVQSEVRQILAQSDGKLLLRGRFPNLLGTSDLSLVRLLSDGQLDSSFTFGTNNVMPDVNVYVDSNGKIYAALGAPLPQLGPNQIPEPPPGPYHVRRLQANGQLDSTFNDGAGASGYISGLDLLPGGKVLVKGWFPSFDGFTQGSLIRLNSGGSVDTTFAPGAFAGTVNTIAMSAYRDRDIASVASPLSTGHILVGGWFTNVGGTERPVLARLASSGSVDVSFAPSITAPPIVIPGVGIGFVFLRITKIREQADGKILVGGVFTTVNGVSKGNLVRLNADGSLDATFNCGAGSTVNDILLQPDGKIIVVGQFNSFDGAPRTSVARLFSNGALDSSFNLTGLAGGTILSAAIDADGKLLLGGSFTNFVSQPCPGIVRTDISALTTPTAAAFKPETLQRRPDQKFEFQVSAETNRTVTVQFTTNMMGGSWTTLESRTLTNGVDTMTDVSATNQARRLYRVIIR